MSARISWLDVKLGVRMMLKHPALTLVGGLGIAIGVAVSVGFYAFSTAYINPTLPLPEGDRIVALENRDIRIDNEVRSALYDFYNWREELRSVEDLTAFRTVQRNLITGDGPLELVQVAGMTAAGFRVARVSPQLGRYLVPDDEKVGAPAVLVIGYDVWRNRFGSDPRVVGREVRLGTIVHTIVGVMPEGFAFPESHAFWIPLRQQSVALEPGGGPPIFIAGRLAPGVTMETAQAELSVLGQRTSAAHKETHEFIRPMVMPYTHSLTDIQGITQWQFVQMNLMMSLLLVVIALNVAVLVYARTAARHSELVVRHALGASRGRVVAQLFAEALVLSLVAAAFGVALAQVGIAMGNRIMAAEVDGAFPFWMDTSFQPSTIVFAVMLAVVTAVFTGVLPALQATGRRIQSQLRQAGSNRMGLGRAWTALIVMQVAIAVAALPAAVNMGWTEIRKAATRRTFNVTQFASASLVPEASSDEQAKAQHDVNVGARVMEIMERLKVEPAVAGATYASSLPNRGNIIRVEGLPAPIDNAAGHSVVSTGIHPSYTDLIDARVLAGRTLDGRDLAEGATGVVVTESFVRTVLKGESALGRRIRHVDYRDDNDAASTAGAPEQWYEIVGVIADLQKNPFDPELVRPSLYYAIAPGQLRAAGITVRFRGPVPAGFADRFRAIAAEVDPTLRLGTVRLLANADQQQQTAARLVGLAVGLVLLSTMLLSAAGIYAIMSFIVTQRRREIGIRTALGADTTQLLRSVFARAAGQIALGVITGVAVAAVIERITDGGLVAGRGIILLPAIALLTTMTGLLAAMGPARRGLRIQPTEALKSD